MSVANATAVFPLPIQKIIPSTFPALVKEMHQLPKVELHLHLGGSWPIDFLRNVAKPADFSAFCHFLDLIDNGIDYHEEFKAFGLVEKIVNTDQLVEEGTFALCKNLAQDNVFMAEIRTGLKDTGTGFEGYLKAVLKGLKRGRAEFNLKLGLVLSLRRNTSKKDAEKTLELAIKYRGEGIIGFDLSGDSTVGNGQFALAALNEAAKEGFPITLHLGENAKECHQQQLNELIALNPKRVGHCVFLGTPAKEWIIANKTPVEMCLTSALKVKMIDHHEEHPALALLKAKHPVLICTDDPSMFKVSLSDECAYAALQGITMDEIKQAQQLSVEYSFFPK